MKQSFFLKEINFYWHLFKKIEHDDGYEQVVPYGECSFYNNKIRFVCNNGVFLSKN